MNSRKAPRAERRRFPRRSFAARIDLSRPYDAAFSSGRTLNVTAGGVAVRILETVPEVGDRLDFGFRLDSTDVPVRGVLEIVWVRPFHGPDGAHDFGARIISWHRGDRGRIDRIGEHGDPSDGDPRSEDVDSESVRSRARPSDGPRTPPRVGLVAGRTAAVPRPRETGRDEAPRGVRWVVVVTLLTSMVAILGLSVVSRRHTEAPEVLVPAVPSGRVPEGSRGSGSVHDDRVTVTAIAVRQALGMTVVQVETDSEVDVDAVVTVRLEGPPRLLLRLRGLADSSPRIAVSGDDPRVSSIRTVYRETLVPPEMHVVLALRSPDVRLQRVDVSPEGVTVRLGHG